MSTKQIVINYRRCRQSIPFAFSMAAFLGFGIAGVHAQTSFTSTSATTAWNAARWNNTADVAPYTSTFTANNAASFTSGAYSFAGMGATVNVGNVTVSDGVTVNFPTVGSTFGTGGVVRTFTIGTGASFDFQSQAISTAGSTGFIKSGPGVFALGGGTYTGGFTLNQGTVVARGVNAMGSGGALSINGGTIAGSATRDFSAKYAGGITVGGDFQLGALTSDVASSLSAANLTFNNNVAFGAATRAVTIGATGAYTLGGVISGGSGTGLTVNAGVGATGVLRLSGANTYDGVTTVNGGTLEVSVIADGGVNSGLGASSSAASNVILNGGTLSYIGTVAGSTNRSLTLGANGGGINASGTIPLGLTGSANAGNGTLVISGNVTPSATTGSQTLALSGSNGTNNGLGTISGVIGNGSGTNVTAVSKAGTGTWTLSGVNSFTGATTITGGTLKASATGGAALGTTSALSVTGGTLMLGGSDQISNTANLTLGTGGVFNLDGKSEGSGTVDGLGSLILDATTGAGTAIIDFGTTVGSSILTFSGAGGRVGKLLITNFEPGTDHLVFDNIAQFTGAYDQTNISINGVDGYGTAVFGNFTELTIIPVPEPATIFGALGLIGLVGFRERRRVTTLLSRFAAQTRD